MNLINKYKELFKTGKITLYPKNQDVKGRVLFSYLHYPTVWTEHHARLSGHSNRWESREITNIFTEFGFIVDAVHYQDFKFKPEEKYDVVFDIGANLQRLEPYLGTNTIKILHLTESYPYFNNQSEIERIKNLEERRKVNYKPARLNPHPELIEKSIEISDICSLIGNETTLNTYPEKFKNKINLVTVSASKLDYIKQKKEFIPEQKEFLWFFGYGPVHKGLDLVLEVFEKYPELKLNIISNLEVNKEFKRIYNNELKLPNIKYHGYIKPDNPKFSSIIKNCFAIIAPSCAESISTAVATGMQSGLFPIISRNTGITLPENCGIYLETCSIEEIEKAVIQAYNLSETELIRQIAETQRFALNEYSRENFSRKVKEFLEKAVN